MAKASSKKPRDTPPLYPKPARVDPCLATLVDKPPKGQDWGFEVKWDGYRLAVHIEPAGSDPHAPRTERLGDRR
ncbi:hypothetical protein GOB04_17705 [Sinorhizobium meliloti]|nr:hypothetical protein [Sinorhizobium meliloti]